jgi:nucleotide sugar dehydrogenase
MMKNKLPVKHLIQHDRGVSVCGLGFVGSTIAAVLLRHGYSVVGLDVKDSVVKLANRGKTHTLEPGVAETFETALRQGRFHATTNPAQAYASSSVKVVAVPVGVKQNKPDLSILTASVSTLAKYLKLGDSIVVSPTIPVGTSRKLLVPLVEEISSLTADRDFNYVYNPERISYGQAIADFEENYPLIISGIGQRSLKFAEKFYSPLTRKGVIRMSSTDAAEAEKTFEGIYRDVNIALANELGSFCENHGIDFWEIRSAANSQPYSHIHKTGLGVGGFCIPVYPYFLINVAGESGIKPKMTMLARRINDSMPGYHVQNVARLFANSSVAFKDRKVALLGLAFRGDVPDKRLSPTYDVIREFSKFGPTIFVHDPLILSDRDLPSSVVLTSKMSEALENADIVMVCTDHSIYRTLSANYIRKYSKKEPVVFDGRAILDPKKFIGYPLIIAGKGDKVPMYLEGPLKP